ncbi:chromosome segregation protein SMC [Acetivibrio saccincola]|uniref:Chromosome partition protein Smc n=1 Tax=Acetivibrio saccincola TaxID=1677857 RepID=A0A2S8RCQ8_9FIRM|nr:chromosome segregation protein SMC [Acetivibrio saccincola]PQQ67587.1 chromosome segregation protein SMC [Acetivibrio saccincola]
MHLKRLEVQGFKSFAEKIVLEFNSGITAVVGPNGSGKSNISDAIRWVLGEQSAKTLRGGKMEDVIFAGTEHRKPLGFAEVSLCFDNTDRTLPIDYSEVIVTRRVYRSGESEYKINKTNCRLKDITELFLDTGIGKDGYSIIGQGRVDEILSTKSEERRHIFEEASGIMKYKIKKQEAEKKLEMTSQNLLRINDIILELESQLEPLKEQTDKAKRYLSLRDDLKELEVSVYVENISKLKSKMQEIENHYTTIKNHIDTESKKLEEITMLNQKKSHTLKDLDEKLERAKEKYYSLEGNLERCSSEIKLNEEKKINLKININRLNDEISEINKRIEELCDEEKERKEKVSYLKDRYLEFNKKLEEYNKKLKSLLDNLSEDEKYIEKLKENIMNKFDLQGDKKSQANNVKNHIEIIQKRQNSIENELKGLSLEKDGECIKLKDLKESISNTENLIINLREKINDYKNKKTSVNNELEKLKEKQNNLRSEIHVKVSRHKMLSNMESNLEGYTRSVKMVLKACKESSEFGQGIHGALVQLINVEKRYETAIEMSLGGALQNIVTSTEEDAKRAIGFLKKNQIGRATFLPISSVKGRYFDERVLDELKRQEGFIGVASDLVNVDSLYRGIILSFLGRVVVVDNLDSGIKIARRFNYAFKIVTLDGDIISSTGSMSGGSKNTKESGILSRNREIAELKEVIEKLKEDEKNLENKITGLSKILNTLIEDISIEEENLRNKEHLKIRDESHLMQIEENIKRIESKEDMLKQEIVQLKKQEENTQKELYKYLEELKEIEEDIKNTKEIVAEYEVKHKENQYFKDLINEDITQCKISINSIKDNIQGVEDALERILKEKDNLKNSIEMKSLEKENSYKEIQSLDEKNEGLRNLIKGYEEEKTGKTLEIDRIIEEKKVLEEESSDIIEKIAKINKDIISLKEEYGRLEVRKAKIESEMEAMQNRMWDEYELTYTNALEIKKDVDNINKAQKRINELRNEIKELGYVNVAAIEEYIKTKERYEFMSVQRDDMENAKEKLQKVINEMVSIMKRQFMEQFKRINESFNTVFRELFDGGHAELILVDKENVLESGIEIEVQPPGKKLQNLMLLSGGEKAFTAIALLFAILRLNPTPFCVLDEIEAALDDANVYKFAQYLKKYSTSTQFAVITHRKGTMEIADTLYGVTMEEHGVSKVVSLKMGDTIN